MPWTIVELKDERLNLVEFYRGLGDVIKEDHHVKEARVGHSKECLDLVNDLGIKIELAAT